MDNLIKQDSKGKTRLFSIDLVFSNNVYIINRKTGLLGGKMTEQPAIIVAKGKVKRTLEEQAKLEYDSLISKQKDKGYKVIDVDPSTLTSQDIQDIIGETSTDQNGFKKHMLAKSITTVTSKVIESVKTWYVSRKIDGVRCSLYYKDDKILSASRGGKTYEYATEHLRTHPTIVKFFKNHPDVIFDGELYVHGKLLQQISGCARLTAGQLPFLLQYYIYDVIEDAPFTERMEHMHSYFQELGISEDSFDPNKQFAKDELMFQAVPQVKVEQIPNTSTLNRLWDLHDLYIKEGWEGCVARNADKSYKCGGRSADMIKLKNYQDAEFKVVGIEAGLRDVEDMVFIMEDSKKKHFKAKPMGSLDIKQEYWDNFDLKYKDRIGTCKYFSMSADGVPTQPIFKAFRDDI